MSRPIYMDNHSTTRVDPRVLDAMLPYFCEKYGNPGSTSHAFGWEAKEAVDRARRQVAACLNTRPGQIVFTSGATESNNLALRGLARRQGVRSGHLISVVTEHRAVLDPLARLAKEGFEVTLLGVRPQGDEQAGRVVLEQLEAALRPDTILVSVMLANNEIGVVQPWEDVARICRRGSHALLHCDATQAVGRLPIDLQRMDVDLLSFSGHKMYGPKGIGGLYVARRSPRVRLEPLIEGGGQEHGLRSGTLNVPGIVGLAAAMDLCCGVLEDETRRIVQLRDRLYAEITGRVPDAILNGPPLEADVRLAANLNLQFPGIDGEALMMSMGEVALSAGSACTSAAPEPSHVLRALGLSDDQVRSSLRFGLGRFNTIQETVYVAEQLAATIARLRSLA